MRICILGHKGMLGHAVWRFLSERGHCLLSVATRFSSAEQSRFLEEIQANRPDWCINCVGKNLGGSSSEELFDLNGRLPELCSQGLPAGCGFIHASSDGVFAPDRTVCSAEDTPDASDLYGRSKRDGEISLQRPNDFVVRCSIVGPEQDTKRSLMAWFLSQNVPVKGFTNQTWNGITTLQWAKVSHAIMRGQALIDGRIIQPASLPCVSKCDLLEMIAKIWRHDVPIHPTESQRPITRVLWPNLPCPPLVEQLQELHDWYR